MRTYLISLMDRTHGLWKEPFTIESVSNYLKELETSIEAIRGTYQHIPKHCLQGDEVRNEVTEILKDEADNCRFWLELEKKKQTRDFDQWKLVLPEDRLDLNEWDLKHHSAALVRSNGRVRAIVEVNEKKGIMSQVTLIFRNDSAFLTFYSPPYRKSKSNYKRNLSNPESINEYVERLKEVAEDKMEEMLFPCCKEKRNYELLCRLLHIEEEV